jgi:WD40 repeat protein
LEPVNSIAISPNGSLVAAGLHDVIMVWDYSTREQVAAELKQQGDIVTVVFSPNGKMLATGSAEGSVILWKVEGNTFTQMGETLSLTSTRRMLLAFSPDNQWLAGGSLGFAYLWDTATVLEVARIPHGSNPVTSVSFTNDGTKLLTVSRKVVRVWNVSAIPFVPDNFLIEYACSRLTSNLSRDEWTAYFGETEYNSTCPNLMEKK